jgi:hypothetical protein
MLGHRFRCVLLAAATCITCGASHASLSAASNDPEVEQDPSCVAFWPEIRYRNYGYDHVVHLANRCGVRAFCSVATDVNPTAVQVRVPPRQQTEVLTFRGAAARQFVPLVECRYR